MHFHKYPHPSNFDFVRDGKPGEALKLGAATVTLNVTAHENGIFRITAASKSLWPKHYSQAGLELPPVCRKSGAATLTVGKGFSLQLKGADGTPLLTSPAGATFGVCGRESIFVFHRESDCQFYGMGEKALGLELSGKRTKFWNTDVWGDFSFDQCVNGRPDPMYVSVPYLIVKRGNTYVGLLLDNPHSTFVSTAPATTIAGQMALKEGPSSFFWLGAENGVPDLYILTGPSLPELTRKLQKLVGTTPLPPAWALGYHQCRWGYRSAADLDDLDDNFRRNQIPCDGLWLDIDYMDGYRVFTFNPQHFPNPGKEFRSLEKRGRKVVPILDPGVKSEKGYPVYDSGHKADVFCRNPQGREFIGMVWPGETVFPDFSTEAGRGWWANQVKSFAGKGLYGAWLDMNDPSTGHSEVMDMLFNGGREAHDTFHNQYALGMAKASRAGFLAAHPDRRPFLLCRSGATGTSKHTAIWTGDNYSNYHHLRNSIPCSLNLALSGIPFNGPDIGGFGGSTNRDLLGDWMKACFLFPVCRNHTEHNSIHQEPWVFGRETMEQLRHYIRSRYKLRPYLYNLFAAQEETGEAILRPLFYEFADSAELPLGRVDDQFMVGPWIMQAPFVVERAAERHVVLPGPCRWYAAHEAGWGEGGVRVTVKPAFMTTPLYVREGAVIPMAVGEVGGDNGFDSRKIEFHLFLSRAFKGTAATDYVFDDGASFAYRKGKRSRLHVAAKVGRGGVLEISTKLLEKGFGDCAASFVLYGDFARVTLNGRAVKPRAAEWCFAGTAQSVQVV